MASCRSAEPVERTPTAAARLSCQPTVIGAGPVRGANSVAPSCGSSAPPHAADPPFVRPTRPIEEAVVLADSAPAADALSLSEDGRVTSWCAGTDERFAWRWFEQLAAQGVRVVLARLDGYIAVFREPLPRDSDDVPARAKQRRTCLRCGKSFWSTNPGNRICRFCGIRNAGVIQGFGKAEEE